MNFSNKPKSKNHGFSWLTTRFSIFILSALFVICGILGFGLWEDRVVVAQETIPKAPEGKASDFIPEGKEPPATPPAVEKPLDPTSITPETPTVTAPAAPSATAPETPPETPIVPKDPIVPGVELADPTLEAPLGGTDPLTPGGIEPLADPLAATTDPAVAGDVPDIYTIQKGDTLWDISGRFFGKPFYWPKIWAYNQYISNPHWIYPGNKLRFRPGTETVPPTVEVSAPIEEPSIAGEPVPVEGEEVAESTQLVEGELEQELEDEEVEPLATGIPSEDRVVALVTLREDAYITQVPEKSVGTIFGSFQEVFQLADSHAVYLSVREIGQVQKGDLYTVYREMKRVKGLGYLNRILGVVEVTDVAESVVKGFIKSSYYDMVRGDKIRNYTNALHKVEIIEPSNQVDGNIVERLRATTVEIGTGDTVFINRGNRDGVEPGYQFFVLRRQDGIKRQKSTVYPEEVVGRLVVVVPREHNSTAVVTYSINALRMGDRISTHHE